MFAKAKEKDGDPEAVDHMRIISKQLMLSLSMQVSLLALMLVLVMPLLQLVVYPEADFSTRSWAERLEKEYQRDFATKKYLLEANGTSDFAQHFGAELYQFRGSVEEMKA